MILVLICKQSLFLWALYQQVSIDLQKIPIPMGIIPAGQFSLVQLEHSIHHLVKTLLLCSTKDEHLRLVRRNYLFVVMAGGRNHCHLSPDLASASDVTLSWHNQFWTA